MGKRFVIPQKIAVGFICVLLGCSVVHGESSPVLAFERQLIDLSKTRIPRDNYEGELASGRLFRTYAQLQEQLQWAQSMKSLLSKTELAAVAIHHLQSQIKQIQDFYKNSISTEILGDKAAYENPDTIIILGSSEPLLDQRLKSALPLIQRFSEVPIILSGGGEGLSEESERMREFLTAAQISPARLIEEKDSLDTIGNAVFSGLILEQKKVPARKILLVTSDFHAPRALLLFKNILGAHRQVAAVLAPYIGANLNPQLVDAQIDKELKEGARNLQEMLSYTKMPGTGLVQHVNDPESVLYQMLIQHDLYKNRWDLLRKYSRSTIN